MIKFEAKWILLLLYSSGLISNIFAQNNHPAVLHAGYEKIYIHFDRPYYSAGETIWFKAYFYSNGFPSTQDNDLCLQLEDASGKIIEKKIYPIAGSTATGNIVLNDSVRQGYYILKAITKAIIADDPGKMYSKSLYIFNAADKQKDTAIQKAILLQFFPESGHLIDRVRTQVAFKATDESGTPLEINGFIKSDSASNLVAFKTLHDGMGRVSFTPHAGDIYYAEVKGNGIKYLFPLPAISNSGIYLKITDADSGKIFEITRSKKDKILFDTVRLVAIMNSDTVFENLLAYGYEETLKGFLKTSAIPSGILHFRILNKDGVPVAERLSFVNNREYIIQPELIIRKENLTKRGENSFELNFNDTVQHSISVSVTDPGAQEFPDRENIYSRLLLTSDLKGYVYNPAFYFEKDDDATRLALDNLMLTQGWTKYNWKKKFGHVDMLKKDERPYLLSISGIASLEKNRQPVSKGTLSIIIIAEDSAIQAFSSPVEKNGRFHFDSLLFFGNARIYYTYYNEEGKIIPVSVEIDKNGPEDLFSLVSKTEHTITPVSKDSDEENAVQKKSPYDIGISPVNQLTGVKIKLLNPIIIKTRITRPQDKINSKYASFLYNSSGKMIVDNINNPYSNRSSGVIEYLLQTVQTIDLYKDDNTFVNKKNFSLEASKKSANETGVRYWPMEVLLDERISSVQAIQSITMDKVAMIKIYEAGFVGVSSSAPGGAIAIYLKKIEELQPQQKLNAEKYFSYKGYSITQEFYSPDYSAPLPAHTTKDSRITLYWNPFINTGSTSKNMKFSFYNNDISKKLSIIIEGFDSRGKLLHYEKIIGE